MKTLIIGAALAFSALVSGSAWADSHILPEEPFIVINNSDPLDEQFKTQISIANEELSVKAVALSLKADFAIQEAKASVAVSLAQSIAKADADAELAAYKDAQEVSNYGNYVAVAWDETHFLVKVFVVALAVWIFLLVSAGILGLGVDIYTNIKRAGRRPPR